MNKIKKFLKALLLFIRMYRDGFYFSDNTHKDPNGTRWGFYRFNHISQHAMYDIDFEFDSKIRPGYFHLHGDDYRVDYLPNDQFKISRTMIAVLAPYSERKKKR